MSSSASRRRERQARRRLTSFLPTSRAELDARRWDAIDILLINGDAYVDHPAFGAALIGRHLEAQGFRVGMISQPDWRSRDDLLRLGQPRLLVGITAGNLDSMLNKLTAQKKPRAQDPYSPGGQPGQRPDRATVVYANLCRSAFPGSPIVIGGIEASLRRIAHYDYWSDQLRRAILLDAKADLLVFGMAERPLLEVAQRLKQGQRIETIRDVPGTGYVLRKGAWESLRPSRRAADGRPVILPSYTAITQSKASFAAMSRAFHRESLPGKARPLLQPHGDEAVFLNPPAAPLRTAELDALYDLPFTRSAHWSYAEPIPALRTVRHSIVTTRGCFGGCSFCSIAAHEGRAVQSRSSAGITREIATLGELRDFRGVISDLGGPTANMYGMSCASDELEAVCRRRSCLHPRLCKHLIHDHGPFVSLLRLARRQPGVRKVFVASGIRHDLALRSSTFVRELATEHTGGQLSVAPEHSVESVLDAMNKPSIECYERFAREFSAASQRVGKDQHLIPYFISGHPGTTLSDMVQLALYLKRHGIRPRQVQDFIPTPMTLATAMHYSGLDPVSGKPVAVERNLRAKRLQKALLLYWDPTQHSIVREALRKAGRPELIGRGSDALVPPARGKGALPYRERRRREQRGKKRKGR